MVLDPNVTNLTAPVPPFAYPNTFGPWMPPAFQQVWGWRIALAYFLIGLGGMIVPVSIIQDFLVLKQKVQKDGGSLVINNLRLATGLTGIIAIALGLLFLVIDAGKPATAWKIITYGLANGRWESWMFLGTGILAFAVILDILYSAIWFGPTSKFFTWYYKRFGGYMIGNYIFSALVFVFGVMSATYGGILFSLTNIPLWRDPIIIVLYPVGGLSAAAATLLILTSLLVKDKDTKEYNIKVWSTLDFIALSLEAILTAAFLYFGLIYYHAYESMYQVVFGSYANEFWTFVVTLGIAIPMVAEIALHKVNPKHYIWMIPLIFILVLIGAFSLRYFVVIAPAYYYPPLSPFTPIQYQFPWGTTW
ncbi:MAG: polysulfide reductase NrfD [Sulfolobaceae archaeon]|nr:polysulfide reductase NrfD [Sulfolobaceae archaeon]